MKKLIFALVAVSVFSCSSTETPVAVSNCDSTCKDSVCVDSIGVKQIIQMDSLHKEGKL